MSEIGAAVANAESIAAKLVAGAAAGASDSVSEFIVDLSGDVVGLIGQEAEDFGNFTDNMAEDVETGLTWSAAWEKQSAIFLSAEKSQLYQDAINGLKQAVAIYDEWLAKFKAAIAAIT